MRIRSTQRRVGERRAADHRDDVVGEHDPERHERQREHLHRRERGDDDARRRARGRRSSRAISGNSASMKYAGRTIRPFEDAVGEAVDRDRLGVAQDRQQQRRRAGSRGS